MCEKHRSIAEVWCTSRSALSPGMLRQSTLSVQDQSPSINFEQRPCPGVSRRCSCPLIRSVVASEGSISSRYGSLRLLSTPRSPQQRTSTSQSSQGDSALHRAGVFRRLRGRDNRLPSVLVRSAAALAICLGGRSGAPPRPQHQGSVHLRQRRRKPTFGHRISVRWSTGTLRFVPYGFGVTYTP